MAFAKLFQTTKASPDTVAVTTDAGDTSGCDFFYIVMATFVGVTPTVTSEGGASANTWAYGTIQQSAAFSQILIGYTTNYPANTNANHTFTITGGSNSFPAVTVFGFSGVKSTSPFDTETTSATTTPGSITPPEDNCLLVTGIAYTGSATPSVTGGFSSPVGTDSQSGVNFGVSGAYLIQTTAGASNPTWTVTGASDQATSQGDWKAQAGGGAATPFITRLNARRM